MAGELRPVVGYRRTPYERAWLCATTDLGHLAAMLARVVPPDHRCAVCVLPFGVDCLSGLARNFGDVFAVRLGGEGAVGVVGGDAFEYGVQIVLVNFHSNGVAICS